MKRMMSTCLWVAAALCLNAITPAEARTKDKWISTKATLVLLTSDDFSVKGANVDTRDGNVVIHGTVGSEADKEKAEATVRAVGGVKSVRNLLQVVPAEQKEDVKFEDSVTRDRVEA